MLMAFGGVVWMSFEPRVLNYLPALGLVVLAALAVAVGMILMKGLRGVSPLQLQAWIGLAGAPSLLALSWLLEGGQRAALGAAPAAAWAAVVYSALGASVLAHGGLYWLIQRHEVSFVSPFTLLSTLFAIAFGVWLMGDVLTLRIVLASLVTLAGVAIVAVRSAAAGADPLAKP